MAWRPGEVWFDVEPRWFCEPAGDGVAALELHAPSFAHLSPAALAAAVPDGLAESRRRRAERRRRREARRTRAAALVVGPAVLLSVAAPKVAGSPRAAPEHDPPSATSQRTSVRPLAASKRPGIAEPRAAERAPGFPTIAWGRARSYGLPYAGSLAGGTQLPVEGPGWVTWNPSRDRIPNAPHRLYGHERVVRALLEVLEGYHAANPGAPRVLVGDLSFSGGGPMDQHRSHQNGLDVDIYYPRLDGTLRPPRTPAQIDRRLAQDLVDRFVASGAQLVFVGYRTGLRGPSEVVELYPNHEDHLHVRFPNPGG